MTLLIVFLLLAVLMFTLKIFAHYNFIRSSDDELKHVGFGDFFYSKFFSKKRILTWMTLYSLRFIKKQNSQLMETNGDIETINRYIRLFIAFIVSAMTILVIGLLTGRIT